MNNDNNLFDQNTLAPTDIVTPVEQPTVNELPKTEEPSVMPQSSFEGEKKKGNLLKPVLVVLLILAAVAAVYFFVFNKKLTAKQSFEASINKQIEKFNELINKAQALNVFDKDNKEIKEKATLKGNLKISSDMEALKELENYSFNFSMGYDTANNGFGGLVNLKDNSGNELSAEAQLDSNNLYINLGNLFDKVIKVPLENVGGEKFNFKEEFNKMLENEEVLISEEDTKYLINLISKAYTDSIKEEDLKSEKVNKKVYDKEISLLKISYELTEEKHANILTNIATAIKNDSKAVDILVNIKMAETKKDVIDELDSFIDNINYMFDKETLGVVIDPITVNIYLNNKYELVMLERLYKNKEGLSYTAYDNKYTFKFEVTEDTGYGKEKNYLNLEYVDADVDRLTLSFKSSDQELEIKLKITDKSTKDEWKNTYNLEVAFTQYDEKIELAVDLDLAINNKFEFTKINPSLAKGIEELTYEEQTTLQNNLKNNKIYTDLFGALETQIEEDVTTNTKCASAVCGACYSGESYCTYYNYATNDYEALTCPCN